MEWIERGGLFLFGILGMQWTRIIRNIMLRGMRRKNKLCQESDRMLLVQCTNHTIHSVNPQTKYKG